MLRAAPSTPPSSTATKVAVGVGAAALLGGLLAALGGKKPATKPVGGSGKGCGACGR